MVTPIPDHDVGECVTAMFPSESLIVMHVPGDDGIGPASSSREAAIERRSQLHAAPMKGIDRVRGMVKGDQQGTVARSRLQLTRQPVDLLLVEIATTDHVG